MKPSDPIAQAMRRVQRATEGGRVTLTLTPSGGYVAHAYLPAHQVSDITLRRLDAEIAGSRSMALGELSAEMEKTASNAIEHGVGKTPVDALEDLLGRLVAAAAR